MSIYKKGATIRILLDQLTEEEFNAIYPYDSVRCEAEIKKEPDGVERLFNVEPDIANRTFLLSSVTAENWDIGSYKLDVRFTRNGEHFYVPQRGYIEFQIIAPVTDDSTEVSA